MVFQREFQSKRVYLVLKQKVPSQTKEKRRKGILEFMFLNFLKPKNNILMFFKNCSFFII